MTPDALLAHGNFQVWERHHRCRCGWHWGLVSRGKTWTWQQCPSNVSNHHPSHGANPDAQACCYFSSQASVSQWYGSLRSDVLLGFSPVRMFFPTCQVRVVRFYQSCSPPRLAVLLLQFLLDHSTMSASTSTCTSALPTLRQALCQLPSSVCTAGPQPGTFPAQCAPLDLNLGAAQLSVHRWTSTWDLPSSVCTAGPQRPDRMPEDMPDRMSDRMPEDMPDKMPWEMPDRMPEDMSE